MYYYNYIWLSVALLVCILIASIANIFVHTTFNKFSKISNSSGLTGAETARKILEANNIVGVMVKQTDGKLTDHFHPKNSTVNLSSEVYNNSSVAAAAIAAHEVGHVVQQEDGYFFYKVRSFLVPVLNFVSRFSFPLVLIGLLIDIFSAVESNLGFAVAMVGVLFYAGSLLFSLITLPVELNASKRAKKMLVEQGILTKEEVHYANKVLTAAALTYFTSFLISLIYFLRFFLYVMHLFGKNRD